MGWDKGIHSLHNAEETLIIAKVDPFDALTLNNIVKYIFETPGACAPYNQIEYPAYTLFLKEKK